MADSQKFDWITGVILAGGLSTRMGDVDKPFCRLNGKSLIGHTIDCLQTQINDIIIVANHNLEQFRKLGLPVIGDLIPGHIGPLGGIMSAFAWVRTHQKTKRAIISVPADAPFIPADIVPALCRQSRDCQQIALASSGGRLHPVAGLWPIYLECDLVRALRADQVRKIMLWVKRHHWTTVDFPSKGVDPFFNINTPDDLAMAHQLAAHQLAAHQLAMRLSAKL